MRHIRNPQMEPVGVRIEDIELNRKPGTAFRLC